jgi:hypothetical protein
VPVSPACCAAVPPPPPPSQRRRRPEHTLHNGRWSTCPEPPCRSPSPKPTKASASAPDSSYRTPDGTSGGGYLLLGRALTFTSGPYNGRRFEAQSASTVLQLDSDGRRTGLRCVRVGPPVGGFSDAPQAVLTDSN